MSNRKTREDEPTAEVQPDEPYVGIGDQLRTRRLQSGGDLQQIAGTLRIRFPYLKAIEEGRFDLLPGTTYANGFVRSYANYLGMDGEAAVASFRLEAAQNTEESRLVFPAPMSEAKIPTGRILLLSLILAGAVYGGWYYFIRAEAPVADMVPPPASALSPVAADPVVPAPAADLAAAPEAPATDVAASAPAPTPATDAPAPATPTSGTVPPSAEAPAASQAATPAVPAPPTPGAAPPPEPAAPAVAVAPVEPAAAVPPPPPPQPTTPEGALIYGDTSDASRISVKAVAFSWIQIRETKGGAIFTKTLRKGEVYRVPPRDDLMLIAGNAGGVEISVDGKVIGRLGEKSQVRRDIRLSAKRLLENGIPPAPPPPPPPEPVAPAAAAPASAPAEAGATPAAVPAPAAPTPAPN